jgi:hypothetical protein
MIAQLLNQSAPICPRGHSKLIMSMNPLMKTRIDAMIGKRKSSFKNITPNASKTSQCGGHLVIAHELKMKGNCLIINGKPRRTVHIGWDLKHESCCILWIERNAIASS